jgi:hypothetical protein
MTTQQPDTEDLLRQAEHGHPAARAGLLERHRHRLRKMIVWRLDRRLAARVDPSDVVAQHMQHWLADTDFNGVRGVEALAKLPEAERGDWQRLREEVAALHKRARPKEK